MTTTLYGNPHSENGPARLSGDMVDEVRCGAGSDTVEADPEDVLRDCEQVERG